MAIAGSDVPRPPEFTQGHRAVRRCRRGFGVFSVATLPGAVSVQEDRLKGILGIVGVVKHAPADPEHHRAVPDNQRLEGCPRGLITPRDEPIQELRVGHRPDCPEVEQPVHLPKYLVR